MLIIGGVNSKKEQKSKTPSRSTQRRQIDKKPSRAKNKTKKLSLSPTSQRKSNMVKSQERSKANKRAREKKIEKMIKTTGDLLKDHDFLSFLGNDKSHLIDEESLTINGSRKSFIPINVGDSIDFTTTWLRTIYGDFMALLRLDDDTIDSTIKQSCNRNYKNYITDKKEYPICYCCGNPILPNDKKACDHLIPIMTMLIIVKPSSIKDNLFNIHYSCNIKKGKDNLMTLYDNAGTDHYPKTNPDAQSICRNILQKNIQKIEFYSIEKIKENLERILKIKILYDKVQDEINMLTQAGKDDAAVTTLLDINKEILAAQTLQGQI